MFGSSDCTVLVVIPYCQVEFGGSQSQPGGKKSLPDLFVMRSIAFIEVAAYRGGMKYSR